MSCPRPGQREGRKRLARAPASADSSICPSSCTSPGRLHPHHLQPATGTSKGTWQAWGQEALARLPVWSPKSSELLRCFTEPILSSSTKQIKQSNIHVCAHGQGRGWHQWVGSRHCLCLPCVLSHPSSHPSGPSSHAGQRSSKQAGSAMHRLYLA